MNNIKAIGATLAILALYISIQFITGFIVPIEFTYKEGASEYILFYAYILNFAVALFIIYKLSIQKKEFIKTRLNVANLLSVFLLALLLTIINDPIFMFSHIFGGVSLPTKQNYSLDFLFQNQKIRLFNTLIVASIVEEVVFRQIIFSLFKKYKASLSIGIIMSSLSFACIYVDSWNAFAAALVLGCLSSIVYLKGGLVYAILFHFFYNLIWSCLFLLYSSFYYELLGSLNFNIVYFLIISISLFTCCFLLRKFPLENN